MAPPSLSADGYESDISNLGRRYRAVLVKISSCTASLIPAAPAAETYVSGIADINISSLFWGRLSLFATPGVLPR